MPTKAEHRATIRNAIHLAMLDLCEDLQWTPDDDELFDAVDRWLERKEQRREPANNDEDRGERNYRPNGPMAYDLGLDQEDRPL